MKYEDLMSIKKGLMDALKRVIKQLPEGPDKTYVDQELRRRHFGIVSEDLGPFPVNKVIYWEGDYYIQLIDLYRYFGITRSALQSLNARKNDRLRYYLFDGGFKYLVKDVKDYIELASSLDNINKGIEK